MHTLPVESSLFREPCERQQQQLPTHSGLSAQALKQAILPYLVAPRMLCLFVESPLIHEPCKRQQQQQMPMCSSLPVSQRSDCQCIPEFASFPTPKLQHTAQPRSNPRHAGLRSRVGAAPTSELQHQLDKSAGGPKRGLHQLDKSARGPKRGLAQQTIHHTHWSELLYAHQSHRDGWHEGSGAPSVHGSSASLAALQHSQAAAATAAAAAALAAGPAASDSRSNSESSQQPPSGNGTQGEDLDRCVPAGHHCSCSCSGYGVPDIGNAFCLSPPPPLPPLTSACAPLQQQQQQQQQEE
eukprot:scaffold66721_cov17-Tisochrysis_lutea.AAC.1